MAANEANFKGKKRGLFIGINYFGTTAQLNGCINDVHNLKSFLTSTYGFPESEMLTLTDDQQDSRYQPTRHNMEEGCKWLVEGAKPGDSLFFHYSGHGGQKLDTNFDEGDGYDETIIPVDFKTKGEITDDELFKMLVQPLAEGVHLTAVFDSCHSGTALDLPFVYASSGGYKTPGISKSKVGKDILAAGMNLVTGHQSSAVVKLGTAMFSGIRAKILDHHNRKHHTSPAHVIMIAGCDDDQTSADTKIAGVGATGAMSFALVHTLKQNPHPSYKELLNSMRDVLHEKRMSQIPQMSASHQINADDKFEI